MLGAGVCFTFLCKVGLSAANSHHPSCYGGNNLDLYRSTSADKTASVSGSIANGRISARGLAPFRLEKVLEQDRFVQCSMHTKYDAYSRTLRPILTSEHGRKKTPFGCIRCWHAPAYVDREGRFMTCSH